MMVTEVAIDIKRLTSIYEIEEEVNRLATTINGGSPETNSRLVIALEIRALRWALIGPAGHIDQDTAVDRLVVTTDDATDHLGDKLDEVTGAIDNLTEIFEPPEPSYPLWYRIYRSLRF